MNLNRHPLGEVKMRRRGGGRGGEEQAAAVAGKRHDSNSMLGRRRPEGQLSGSPGVPERVPETKLGPHQPTSFS